MSRRPWARLYVSLPRCRMRQVQAMFLQSSYQLTRLDELQCVTIPLNCVEWDTRLKNHIDLDFFGVVHFPRLHHQRSLHCLFGYKRRCRNPTSPLRINTGDFRSSPTITRYLLLDRC